MIDKIKTIVNFESDIRRYVKNWMKVSVYVMKHMYPITVNFRDGDVVKVEDLHDLALIISSKKFNLIFETRKGVGDFIAVFIREDYRFLDPRDRIVVDVGAEIGDSSLYFAVKGAKKVIAIEPFPYNFEYLVKNIKSNNFSSKIVALNVLLGDKNKRTFIDIENSPVVRDARERESGYAIDMVTLDYIVNHYDIEKGVLKMDCEGCEYNILKLNNNVISRFEKIQIEYHYGFSGLVNKLKSSGFKVKYTKPKKGYNEDASNPNLETGYIYAEKK